MEFTPQSINELSTQLDKLVDQATKLYVSDAEISVELAEELGYLWEMCRDYVQMYENCSREATNNAPGEPLWFDGVDTPPTL